MRNQRQNYNSNGRTMRKGGLGNFESSSSSSNPNQIGRKVYRDSFHNGEIPLCRLLNDAIEDIFPELQDHGSSNHGNHSQQAQVESGSTLGRMIRRRYLISRKSSGTSLDAKIKEEKMNEDSTWEFNKNNVNFHNNNTNTPPTSTTAKKKRKRKKKKRLESEVSFLPTVITHESNNGNTFNPEPSPSSRNGTDNHFNDGKSMMSTTDHSLEALDEAVKNEAEKLIELEANHELPLLGSLPSDDNIQAQESPSQFIDQIKPQEENILQFLPYHTGPLPLTDPAENITIPSSLPEDIIPGNEDSSDIIWKNPLQLPFLVNVEGEEEDLRYSRDDTQARSRDGSMHEGSKNLTTSISDKKRSRILFHDWIDQFFFMNDECECIETSVAEKDRDDYDSQKDEWDSFIQFCNDRTVATEKSLGIPLKELLEIGSSIECRLCREETLAEIRKMAGQETTAASAAIPTKSSRIVMKSMIIEKPSPETDNDLNVDAAFDYVALEEGNHIPKNVNDEQDEEKSDSNISFLAVDLTIDSKRKKFENKNGNKKKNRASNTVATERYFCLETLTSKQLEEFLFEWLLAGVDEEKLVRMSIRKEIEPCESDIDKTSFPVVISEDELEKIKERVDETQQSFKESLDNMNNDLKKMRCEWRSKTKSASIEMNLDFSEVRAKENCEESCNMFLTEDVLPILTGELSLPTHACAELQIHLWVVYLEVLGKTLNACDGYYKKLEEDLADQNGTLPLIFTSAPFRTIYRELAEEKIGFLSEMGESFSAAASSWSMRDFCTRSCWEQCNRDEQDKSSQKLDEDCRKLIIALTEWTRIVEGGRMSVINKERSKSLVIVFNMLRVVVESLGGEYKAVERYFSQERQNYFSMLLSNIHLAHGVKHRMRLIEMDDVVSLTTGIILMWRHVRIIQSRVDCTISAEILPLSLRKWVLEPSSIDLKLDDMYQHISIPHSKCWPGMGGKRKAMGILAGLAYAWFRERCKEWKAEKASQELLTYFDTELLSSVDPQLANASKPSNKTGGSISKSSKKAKKKKSKKASPVVNGSTTNPTSSSNEENELKSNEGLSHALVNPMLGELESKEDQHILVDKSPEVATQKSTDNTEIPMTKNECENTTNELSEIDNVSFDHGPNFDSHTISSSLITNNETTKSVDNGVDLVGFLHGEKEDNDCTEQPCESQVVVEDESGCTVSAMQFLTDRLVELMRQPENETIVIVSI